MISTKGRYSLRVLVDLAEHQGEASFIPLKEIAQRRGVPRSACSVERVLRLTEGTLAPVSCLEEDASDCPRLADCRTLPIWQGLDRVISDYLRQVSIADLMRPCGEARA